MMTSQILKSVDLTKTQKSRYLEKKELYGPFLWMGFNCLKAAESPRVDCLLFTTKFPGIPGTYLINPRRMKG